MMNRRNFIRSGTLAAAAPAMPAAPKVTLRDKFFGCIAGCHIGSSMGAAVEGLSSASNRRTALWTG